jgi:EmrB/QacA subfamily drug resistance transporter
VTAWAGDRLDRIAAPALMRERRGLVMAIILVGYLLILLDVSILMVALPRIHRELGFSATGLSWAQNAYTLVFGGLLLLGARAGDLLGRRRMFIAGIGLFAIASAAVGLAQSPAWMIGARAVQGVGAAMLAPSTLALLATNFPEGPQRNKVMAAYGALAGIGTSAGLLIGGALTEWLSWRIGFLVNVPIGLIAMLAASRYLNETEPQRGRLEPIGALCSTLGVAALVFGIVHSAEAGWTDTVTIGAIASGTVFVALFLRSQRRSEQPILPLRLFANRERAGAYATRFLFNGALLSVAFFMTQYLQGVKHYSPLAAGLGILPQMLAAFAAAATIRRIGRHLSTASLAVIGCAAMLIGALWLSCVSADTDYLIGIAIPMIIFGIGQGLGLTVLTSAGMAGVAAKDASAAGGLVNVAHHLGGAFGLGVLVTIFNAAGSGTYGPEQLLAHRVGAAFTGASVLVALALLITLIAHPRRRSQAADTAMRVARLAECTRSRQLATNTLPKNSATV